jgi:THO complex subunit 1 transcription elongation factor
MLIQLLILFNHLLTYLPKEKEKWVLRGRGASLQMDFILGDTDAKWIRETWTKVSDELKAATAHVGYKTFQDTVSDLLERERAWVRLIQNYTRLSRFLFQSFSSGAMEE